MLLYSFIRLQRKLDIYETEREERQEKLRQRNERKKQEQENQMRKQKVSSRFIQSDQIQNFDREKQLFIQMTSLFNFIKLHEQ